MFRLFSFIVLFVFSYFIVSCSTFAPKHYSYIPPYSAADRSCIGKCLHAIKYCERICALKNSRSCQCVTSFNTCYMACGGQVIER